MLPEPYGSIIGIVVFSELQKPEQTASVLSSQLKPPGSGISFRFLIEFDGVRSDFATRVGVFFRSSDVLLYSPAESPVSIADASIS